MKRDYKNLLKNVGVFTIANFTTKILNFLILPLYTYYLTTEQYGTIDLVMTTISLLFPVFSLSIVDAVLRFGIENGKNKNIFFSFGFKIICIGTLILGVLVSIAHLFISDSYLLIVFVVVFFFQGLNQLFGAFAKVLNRTKEMALITTLISGITLVLNVLLIAVFKKGIRGYWLAMIFANIIGSIVYFLWLRLYRYINYDKSYHNKKILYSMLVYAIPLIPNSLFWWINSSLDRWTLTIMTSLSAVGLYSCANKLPSLISSINSIFSQAWNLSLFQSKNDEDRKCFFGEIYYFYNETMFCISIVIIMLAKFIAKIMFSKEFYLAWNLVAVLTMGVYYNSLNSFIGSLFTAGKKTKEIFITTSLGSAINLVCNFLFVYLIGVPGAAVSTLVSYIIVWIARVKKAEKIFKINIDKSKAILQFCILGTLTMLMIMDKMWGLVLAVVVIYCMIYIVHILKKIHVVLKK